ncbi:hypothetical protein AaE_010014 [Aphanomyces astaci]|uniref:Uncharacterized protein n=1 Tax=Aphanomyces astaci TaxID=112090 RepID=A0A6A4ZR08_APHAT|nr:hypothetical protein AaE_010014 [Aphanomyces astaci]
MPTATNRWQKILVIKDDMSGIVQFWPSETSDAAATANGLLNWFTTFGQPTDPHAVKTFVNTATKEVTAFDWLSSTRKKHMYELHQAMEQLHREVAATSAKK